MNKFNFTIKSRYSKVTDLINRLRLMNVYGTIKDKIKGEIELCLVEALNNVVKHSYKEDPNHTIQIEFEIIRERIIIKIIENGLKRNNTDRPKLEFDPDDIENLPEGGMGLYIIDQLMDKTEYQSVNGQNIFTMYKNLN
ncbi:MAG: ATP-binding protein [Melioribacteraceae bacterium]|nr:ATP-binding protein [Melioribacteraceae bacterium]